MTSTVPNETRASTAKQLRRMRARRLTVRLLLGVGIPTLLSVVYYGVLVEPQYESVATFTVQSADGAGPPSALQMLVSSVPGSASRDMMLVREYIQSRDMLEHLVKEHGFVEHYGNSDIAWFSRLDPEAPAEERYDYYRDHISVEHDETAGVLTLRIRAFSREKAHELGEAILAASEQMVNRLSERARTDRIELAQNELSRAEERLTNARRALRALQTERGELDPVQSATILFEVRSRLEAELAIARAELETMRATLQPNAPQVAAQRRRVAALQRQIDEQTGRLSGAGTDDLGDTIASFEPLVIEKEFAQHAYQSALSSLELARVDATRQHRYLVRISGPSRPEDTSYPELWYAVLTVFVLSFALLGIGTLLVASIREHANV